MKILFIDFSTGLDDLRAMQTRGRGGMINSLFKVPDALSQLGHDTYVLSDIQSGGVTPAGTRWWTAREFKYLDYDVLVANRGIGDGYPTITAKHRILWTHDLPHLGFIDDPDKMARFDMTVFMSGYADRVWRTHFPFIGKSKTIPNGVDKSIFYPREKDLGKLIYFFHPMRGLKRLPIIVTGVAAKTARRIRCDAYSSIYHGEGTDDHMEAWAPGFDEEAPELRIMPALPIERIAEEVGTAGLCLMPTGYPEICSNSVLQSLFSGTPIVTTGGLGATPEWVQDGFNGRLTEFTPADYMAYYMEFTRAVIAIINDEGRHREMIECAAQTPGILTWEEVGAKWDLMIQSLP